MWNRQPSLKQKTIKQISSYQKRWLKESASLFKPEEHKPSAAIVTKKSTKGHSRSQSQSEASSKPVHQRWKTMVQPQNNGDASPKSNKQPGAHSRQPSDIQENQCSVCCASLANSLFAPCGHGGICHSCGTDVLSTTGVCCFCRSTIVCLLTVAPSPHNPLLFEASAGYIFD